VRCVPCATDDHPACTHPWPGSVCDCPCHTPRPAIEDPGAAKPFAPALSSEERKAILAAMPPAAPGDPALVHTQSLKRVEDKLDRLCAYLGLDDLWRPQ
jgi:hypothetical protein